MLGRAGNETLNKSAWKINNLAQNERKGIKELICAF